MNEMLANQYYLSQRYKEAIDLFEDVLSIHPTNYSAKKKLIICYIQSNQIELALNLFGILISEEIEIIFDSDSERDGCPCKQTIYELENFPTNLTETEKSIALGILWLFCDRINSLKYFKNLLFLDSENQLYKKIYTTINQSISQSKRKSKNEKERHFS